MKDALINFNYYDLLLIINKCKSIKNIYYLKDYFITIKYIKIKKGFFKCYCGETAQPIRCWKIDAQIKNNLVLKPKKIIICLYNKNKIISIILNFRVILNIIHKYTSEKFE